MLGSSIAKKETPAAPTERNPEPTGVVFGAYKKERPVPLEKKDGITLGPQGWRAVFHIFLEKCRHPGLQDEIFFQDDEFIILYDGYPKARHHLLVLPKPSFLDVMMPSDLRREHLPRLRRLHALAGAVAKHLSRQGAGEVRCGYHALPSLEPLHLHIISQDFDAPRMRKIQHWNAFTTDFFLEPSWVEERLDQRERIELDVKMYEVLEKQTPQCHLCEETLPSVGGVKSHYLSHDEVVRVYGPRQLRSYERAPMWKHGGRQLVPSELTAQEGSWRRGGAMSIPDRAPGRWQRKPNSPEVDSGEEKRGRPAEAVSGQRSTGGSGEGRGRTSRGRGRAQLGRRWEGSSQAQRSGGRSFHTRMGEEQRSQWDAPSGRGWRARELWRPAASAHSAANDKGEQGPQLAAMGTQEGKAADACADQIADSLSLGERDTEKTNK